MTPHLPESPDEIIDQIHACYEIGITIVHIHARDLQGMPSYKKSIYQTIIEGVKKHCPDLVICTSISGRNFNEFEKRAEAIELFPDMASLTLSSMNFINQSSTNAPDIIKKLAEKMQDYGVKPELEVFDIGMLNYARYLIGKELIGPPYYFNIILGNIASLQMNLIHVGAIVNDLPDESYWSLGGLGKFQLQANMTAIANGGGVRTGLEDNIYFDQESKQLASNTSLIKRIHQLAKISGRQVMSGREFGKLGFYNRNREDYG